MSTTVESVKAPKTPDTSTVRSLTPHGPRRTAPGGRLLFTLVGVAGIVGAAYLAMDLFGAGTEAAQEYVLHSVQSQDLDIIVVERGSLESGRNVDLVCEVEARSPQSAATTILQIVKEGTHVSKGDLLVELDSASLKDQITQQQIKVEQAKAQLTRAVTDLDITRSQNDSDIQSAQIAVDLADIDLTRYLEGDYLQEKRNIDGEVVIAEEELNRAKERLEYSERLSKKGYVSSSEVEADRLNVIKSQNSLNVAKEKMRVLEQYTKPRQEKDLQSKLDEARRKLERVQNEAKAKEAQSESAMLAQKLTTETEESTLRKLEKQLEKCKIFSPIDGMVVYANDPNSMMRGQPAVQIEEGASVRERQKIIRIPDLNSMLVNVKVHEAKVAHVRPGQPAHVRVESMPDKLFAGTVKTVATTADAQSFFSSSGVQVYTVMVSINEDVEGLKPGMTAEVEIMASRVADVLTVPVQAVVERHGQNYCYVVSGNDGTPTPHRVEVGSSNDKMVVITKGIEAGASVVENLAAVIKEEELELIAKADAEKHKVERPAPVVAKTTAAPETPGAGNGNAAPDASAGPGGAPAKSAGGSSRMLQQYDSNQDGKISLADEVPEDRRGMLTRLDTNGDGIVDGQELAALAARGRGAGGGGGGPGGGGGGPGGFSMPATGAEWLKTNDKNGDGRVAKDELSEFAQNFWSTMDTNSDGFVDGAEADALVERMKQMRQQGGFGGGSGGPGSFSGPPGAQP